jgi:hypothetical protein
MALDGIKDGKYSLAEDGGGRVGNDARWRDTLARKAVTGNQSGAGKCRCPH